MRIPLSFLLLDFNRGVFDRNELNKWLLLFFFLGLDDIRVGIDLPTIEVRFENLSIEAEARAGTRALPTFTNFIVNILEVTIGTKLINFVVEHAK